MAAIMRRYVRAAALGASSLALATASPAFAQATGAASTGPAPSGATDDVRTPDTSGDIVVTAQRQSQSLQSVPIAVTAITAEGLAARQVQTSGDLQFFTPNLTITRGNFTDSKVNLRGVGEGGAEGLGRDTAVGIHINDMPLLQTRIIESELYDLERVEVLRGPQGTLFGRNASAGVINFITAKPGDALGAAFDGEFANYGSVRAQGMINLPLADWASLRVAGLYLRRDGYTRNLYDGSRIDGRRKYSGRATLRLQPASGTTLDVVAQYFNEDDTRLRAQKQLCHRDPTGVLGCLPDRLDFQPTNANATLSALLTSREFFTIAAGGPRFGIGSIYGPDAFAGSLVPADYRQVSADYNPSFSSAETILMGRLQQALGDRVTLTVTGGYQEERARSQVDYNLVVGQSLVGNPGIAAYRAAFPAVSQRLFQGQNICVSVADRSYVGFIGGKVDRCNSFSTEYDIAQDRSHQYSVEAHVDSKFDGPLNFLLGGIYVKQRGTVDYFVATSGLDYAGAVLVGPGAAAGALAPSFYNNEGTLNEVKSYAGFGELYLKPASQLQFTLGLRWTRDEKRSVGRQPLYAAFIPYGTQDANAQLATLDVDPGKPGQQAYIDNSARFSRLTGRFVIDWTPTVSFTDSTLVYASVSRGYRAGGANGGFDPRLISVPPTYKPETIYAYELGTKNRFANGLFQANLAAFFYDYRDNQISRNLFRSGFIDNVNATVYGLEGEFQVRPATALQLDLSGSLLRTRLKRILLPDARDPTGGRSDVVVIKDVTNASNCALVPRTAGTPRGDAVVNAVNAALGLQPTVPLPATTGTGAFSICSAVGGAVLSGGLPYIVSADGALPTGADVDLTGRALPYAPRYKLTAGAQYTLPLPRELSLVGRVDYSLTGRQYARAYNLPVDRIPAYGVVNAQATLNGEGGRWYFRAFVQNLTNSDAITGQYLSDPAPGLFTNVFTLEPRRYGGAFGFRF